MTSPNPSPASPTPELPSAPPLALPDQDVPPGAAGGYPYHRLARSRPNYRWWHPLTTVLVALVVLAVLTMLATVATAVAGMFVPGIAVTVDQALSAESDLTDPGQLVVLFGSVTLLWPAAALGVRWGGGRPAGTLSSIAGRLRWRPFPKLLALAVALFAVLNGLSMLLPVTWGQDGGGGGRSGNVWLLLLVVLAVVPLQAAAEEYAFRGLLMQGIGSWLRHPAFAILLPVPIFVLGHGYGLVGQIDVAAFAVATGWMTWRTGGLEAAIALHVINNVGVFALGAVGLSNPNATDMPLASLPFSLAFLLAYSLLAVRRFPAPARRAPAGSTIRG
ncbi:CPBP family intramembrane glutamic endopeptidase [Arthrobacter sp. zg-Y750]|uniref:CPBP family intramembrane glutamic endopeptidase n=1 Tax=Arthrobacter sp. zg-Y750 TaxID=2894189 RepID=UPI001E2AF288|nr:CPBP family intramembrane glutamic endopeptidase [Arthrobacter sp. zg-Y750]MCC9178696.1 CPBP family intramembrane metalloprotease [Arthrobacter sp. zg-Y750]